MNDVLGASRRSRTKTIAPVFESGSVKSSEKLADDRGAGIEAIPHGEDAKSPGHGSRARERPLCGPRAVPSAVAEPEPVDRPPIGWLQTNCAGNDLLEQTDIYPDITVFAIEKERIVDLGRVETLSREDVLFLLEGFGMPDFGSDA